MESIDLFLKDFDWNGFSLNILVSGFFFILSVVASIKLVPYFTIRLIQRKNRKYIKRRTTAIVQEICRFLNNSPYRDFELHQYNLSIFTSRPEDEGYQFAGLVKINVRNEVLRLKIFIVVAEYFNKMETYQRFESLKNEYDRLVEFRQLIENILGYHSLHLDEEIISEVSEICLDIRSFELAFEFNQTLTKLFTEKGNEMPGVSGVGEIAKIYQRLLEILNRIIERSNFKTELSS